MSNRLPSLRMQHPQKHHKVTNNSSNVNFIPPDFGIFVGSPSVALNPIVMKKFTLLFVTILFSGLLWAQDCSDLFISEYVEGWNNNKALEIYNHTPNVITLNDTYRLIRWSNGSTIADQDIQYVLPLTGDIQPYQTMVLIQDTNYPGNDTMVWAGLKDKATFLAPADYNAGTQGCRVVFWNGDDAISIQKLIDANWIDIDIFGEIGVRPLNWQGETSPPGAWTDDAPYWRGTGAYLTQNQTLIRRDTVMHGVDRATMNAYGNTMTGGFPNSFNALYQYDSLPANFFDSLGHHTCKCQSLGINDPLKSVKIMVYPNPVSGDQFTVMSPVALQKVTLFNLLGEQVFTRNLSGGILEVAIPVDARLSGQVLFLEAVTRDQQRIIQKVIIQ